MFYGTISQEGDVRSDCSHSNNFSVEKRSEDGLFIITFDQYLKYRPTVTLAALNKSGNRTGLVSYAWEGTRRLKIYTGDAQNRIHRAFSFVATPGMMRHFEVTDDHDTITLVPTVKNFKNSNGKKTKVLVLEAKHPGLNIFLDKGTKLIAVGSRLNATLSTRTVKLEGHTWNLSAWTYGVGQGPYGTKWAEDENDDDVLVSPTLQLGREDDYLLSSPFAFAILGELDGTPDPDNGIPERITSDPVVQLSSVAAGGLILS